MKVLYTGSFNPWHKGHQYVYDCACRCFGKDNVFVGIAINPAKVPKTESLDNHLKFLKWTLAPITKNIITYTGLTSVVCKENDIELLIRGIRPGKSLEYEEDMMYWNFKLGNVQTIFIPTPPDTNQISSSVIRELNNYKVKLDDYVNQDVYYRWLKNTVPSAAIYFGKSCCGKTTFLNQIDKYDSHFHMPIQCDKVIWDYVDFNMVKSLLGDVGEYEIEDIEDFKSSILRYMKFLDQDMYDTYMEALGQSINHGELFNLGYNYDAPVLGNHFKYIPKTIISKFRLVKITTSEENRIRFAKAKGWNPIFLKTLDSFYQDPPYWDEEIVIE